MCVCARKIVLYYAALICIIRIQNTLIAHFNGIFQSVCILHFSSYSQFFLAYQHLKLQISTKKCTIVKLCHNFCLVNLKGKSLSLSIKCIFLSQRINTESRKLFHSEPMVPDQNLLDQHSKREFIPTGLIRDKKTLQKNQVEKTEFCLYIESIDSDSPGPES